MSLSRCNNESPFYGRTYSLREKNRDSENYYGVICRLTDELSAEYGGLKKLNDILFPGRRFFADISSFFLRREDRKIILRKAGPVLAPHTKNVASYCKSLGIIKKFDPVLNANEESYHAYMLGIEILNRLNSEEFHLRESKFAFLPHCLRDHSKTCLASSDGFDYICKGCTKNCTLNQLSGLLRQYDIKPYIWMTADIKEFFASMRKQNKAIGVLGIACIPELFRGMNLCMRSGIPVLGLPLDANRCARWFGEFLDNSVNFNSLEKLIRK